VYKRQRGLGDVYKRQHQGGHVDGFVTVCFCAGSSLANAVEGVVDLVNELLVAEVTSADNDEVVAEVVGCLVVFKVVDRKCSEEIGITFDWLA
jgi:hypothetical protein